MCVPFLVSCVLGLVISSEEGSSLLTNGSVLFWNFFYDNGKNVYTCC